MPGKFQFFLLSILISLSSCYSAVKTVQPRHTTCTDCYSLDKLPEAWRTNAKTLIYIDDIIPNTVTGLNDKRSCISCDAPFKLGISLEDMEVLSRSYENQLAGQRASEAFNYDGKISYTFKSYLTVLNERNEPIARVLIVDPEEDIFSVKLSFTTPTRKIETTTPGSGTRTYEDIETTSPEVYMRNMTPGEERMFLDTQSKLKKVSERLAKLLRS